MNKTFIRQTVRLYPNKNQIQFLNQDIGNQRFVWNHFLAETKKLYEEEKKFLFYSNTASLLIDLKKQNEFLQIGNSQCLQQTLRDFDLALKAGYKQQKGFPKFKKKSSCGSIRLPQDRCEYLTKLIEERNVARKEKNWKRSDEIRNQLKEIGIIINDEKI